MGFLKGKANLDKIWKRFDRDGNGFIDEKELEDLIYCALCFFCTERDPDMPEPPREQCEPFVKKIIMDLKPTLDENDDGVISREEFEAPHLAELCVLHLDRALVVVPIVVLVVLLVPAAGVA